MKIVIVGAGRVGGSLAERLIGEDNDVVLVDKDSSVLQALQANLDIGAVVGLGADPDTLIRAGGDSADMIIAVTDLDETNMIVCQIAYTIFQTPTKIARIRSQSIVGHSELFQKVAVPIDVCISPEQLVADYIKQLIDYPGVLQILDFAEGQAQFIVLRLDKGSSLVGQSVREWYQVLSDIPMRVIALYRDNQSLMVDDTTTILAGDEVGILTVPKHVRDIIAIVGKKQTAYAYVLIAGGGNVGGRLSKCLESKYQVKVVEQQADRANALAAELEYGLVLHGDASDRDLLYHENVERVDVFCAVTNDDEANIMSSIQAKRLGAKHTITLINRSSYVELVDGQAVDLAIAPQHITIGHILKYIRHGDIANVYSVHRGAAEVIELVVHGDEQTSQVVNRTLAELHLPTGIVIGAVVRDDQVWLAEPSLRIAAADHVIIFLSEKKQLAKLERLFQVKLYYFG